MTHFYNKTIDMKYNEKKRLQIALRRLYTGQAPSKEILNLIGTGKDIFVNHINTYRISGMTDENFGKEWSLDHVVPVDVFDVSDEQQLKLCYNYHNIMPMFLNDNRIKGASSHFSVIKLNNLKNNTSLDSEVINKLIVECEKHNEKIYAKYLV
jgi:hypothetical protein